MPTKSLTPFPSASTSAEPSVSAPAPAPAPLSTLASASDPQLPLQRASSPPLSSHPIPKLSGTPTTRLFVHNIDSRVTELTLIKLFSRFNLKRIHFPFHTKGPLIGHPRGYCFLSFQTVPDALKAYQFAAEKMLCGRRLGVKFDDGSKVEHHQLPSKATSTSSAGYGHGYGHSYGQAASNAHHGLAGGPVPFTNSPSAAPGPSSIIERSYNAQKMTHATTENKLRMVQDKLKKMDAELNLKQQIQ